jgi:PAS domain S-box-containing protein
LVENGIKFNIIDNFVEIHNKNFDITDSFDFIESKNSYNQFCNQFLNDFEDNNMLVYQLFNSHSAMMLLINPEDDGRIVLANYAASKFYGYSQIELQSMKISEINTMDPESIKNEMNNAKKSHRNYFLFKHKLADSSIREVEVFSTPLFLKEKKLLFSIIHDITERNLVQDVLKQTNIDLINSNNNLAHQLVNLTALYNKLIISENQLTDLNSRKDKFFMIISHDLKALLYTLLQYINLVKKDFESLTTEELHGLTNLIYDAGVNLNKLLDNLLYWSNIATSNFEVHCNDYLLRNIIESNIELFKPEAHFKKLIFENHVDSYSSVCIDIHILNTIFRNLLSNALKFSNQNGIIKIWQYDLEDDKIVVVIEDNGIGMSESDAACLFRIDKILRSYGTSGEVGSGMGLIIIKDLIEKCGGEIWFDLTPDNGTKFYFTLSKSK